MPRNRYTTAVRVRERVRHVRRTKALVSLSRTLRRNPAEVAVLPVINQVKVRRSARLEQNRRHKPARPAAAAAVTRS